MKNTNENVTAYAAAKICNAILRDEGMKEIKSQMIYNYVHKGYIPHHVINERKYVRLEDLAKWLQTYIEKKRNNVDEIDIEANAEEVRNLMGM